MISQQTAGSTFRKLNVLLRIVFKLQSLVRSTLWCMPVIPFERLRKSVLALYQNKILKSLGIQLNSKALACQCSRLRVHFPILPKTKSLSAPSHPKKLPPVGSVPLLQQPPVSTLALFHHVRAQEVVSLTKRPQQKPAMLAPCSENYSLQKMLQIFVCKHLLPKFTKQDSQAGWCCVPLGSGQERGTGSWLLAYSTLQPGQSLGV